MLRTALKPIIRLRRWFRLSMNTPLRWDAIIGGEIVLTVDNIPGHFMLPAVSDLARRIIMDGCYEPEVTKALKQFSNIEGVVVDVGANVGLYASYFAHMCQKAGKVVAIEANPEAYKYLVQNMDRNDLSSKVETVNACIGSERKFVEFAYVAGKPEYSSVAGIVHPAIQASSIQTISIPQIQLDEVVSPKSVSLIFVDVEGAEEYVFRGAEKILRESHPILFFECSDILLGKFGCSSQGLVRYLSSLGYHVTNPLANDATLPYPYEGEAVARYTAD
jgi:FkbM family methyltransferase